MSAMRFTPHHQNELWSQFLNREPAVETALGKTIAAYGSFSSSCVCLQFAEQC